MAVDTIKPQDLEEQQKTQQTPKFNQLNGLQNMFSQQQQQTKTIPNQNAAQVQNNVAGAQNQKNAYVVGQGAQAQQKVNNNLNSFTVGAAPTVKFNTPTDTSSNLAKVANRVATDTTSYAPNATDYSHYGQDISDAYNADEQLRSQALQQLLTDQSTQNNAIDSYQLAQQNQLGALTGAQTDYVNGLPTQNLTDVGKANQVETQAAGTNAVLADPNANGLSKLASLFNKGYNTEKYGGLDSQIYNKDLDNLSGQAKLANQATSVSQQGAGQATGQYLKNLKDARDAIANKQTSATGEIAANTAAAKQDLESKYQDARNKTDQEAHLQGLRDDLLAHVNSAASKRADAMNTQKAQQAQRDDSLLKSIQEKYRSYGWMGKNVYNDKVQKEFAKEKARQGSPKAATDGAL